MYIYMYDIADILYDIYIYINTSVNTSVRRTLVYTYTVRRTVYVVHYTTYIIRRTLYVVQYTSHSVRMSYILTLLLLYTHTRSLTHIYVRLHGHVSNILLAGSFIHLGID